MFIVCPFQITHHCSTEGIPPELLLLLRCHFFTSFLSSYLFLTFFGDNFKLNVYSMVFGPTHKIGNNASKIGIFLWSKTIKTIWICRIFLQESKPCNKMEIF